MNILYNEYKSIKVMQKLPLGEQDFTRLIEDNDIYVDKTKQIYEMLQFSNYIFLSRPRRFGKSLLVSTLAALYTGKKELFKGLWIEDKWEWETYPVLRLDFSKLSEGGSLDELYDSLMSILEQYAEDYNLKLRGNNPPTFLNSLLEKLHEKTGKRVVLLIDEYDKPITNHLIDLKKAERNRQYLRSIYEIIKANSEHIHFLFVTGISKFAKMSIFSVVNHLNDISLMPEFNDIVGFSEQEITDNFGDYLDAFSKKQEITTTHLMDKIRYWYDGFSWDGTNFLYNPFAIVKAFGKMDLQNYWFETGTPSFLMDLIKHRYALESQTKPLLKRLEGMIASKETFDSYDLENINLKAILFQTGYLTIKEKIRENFYTSYILGFPNYEVKHAFNAHLIKAFTQEDISADIKGKAIFMLRALREGNKDNFLKLVRSIFSGIPSNNLKKMNEYAYQAMFYQLLLLLGIRDIFLEVSGYIGRADGVLVLGEQVFVFELKFARKGTMKYLLEKAAIQSDTQGYLQPYLGTDRTIYRVSMGFLYKSPAKDKKAVLTIDSAWDLVE